MRLIQKTPRHFIKSSIVLALLSCLSACGTKGALIMPPSSANTAKPVPATLPAAAKSADDSKSTPETGRTGAEQ